MAFLLLFLVGDRPAAIIATLVTYASDNNVGSLGGVTWPQWGAGGIVVAAVLMVFTDRLVPGKRLAKAEAQRDEWQRIALLLLGVADRMTTAQEQAVEVVDRKVPPADLIVAALLRAARDDPAKGGGADDVIRLAAEEAARRIRGEGR